MKPVVNTETIKVVKASALKVATSGMALRTLVPVMGGFVSREWLLARLEAGTQENGSSSKDDLVFLLVRALPEGTYIHVNLSYEKGKAKYTS